MSQLRIPLPATSPGVGLLILRLAVAVVILFHGAYKVANGIDWMSGLLAQNGLPAFLRYGVYVAELVAPVLLIVGLWTRLAALVIAFDMVMAVLLALREQVFAVKPQGGGWGIELEALIGLAALVLFFTGGGKYSVSKD
jgi:putative oxidoreductase